MYEEGTVLEEGKRILVVDDEPKIIQVLHSYLESKGFAVFPAGTAGEALELFRQESFSLVILDLMLPDLPGEEVCRTIRQTSSVPIIMLTAKVEEADLVAGLGLGADDFITKPFSLRALHARVEAVLRRCAPDVPGPRHRIVLDGGGLEIDVERHMVTKRGEAVSLTPNEFKLLLTMARQPRKVFCREELIILSLGMEYDGFDRTVDSHIKNLRRKIEDDPQRPTVIRTVHGVGYRLGGDA